MLGDKLLTDTLGARRSGVLMLMVEPRGGAVGAWNHVLHALRSRSRPQARTTSGKSTGNLQISPTTSRKTLALPHYMR